MTIKARPEKRRGKGQQVVVTMRKAEAEALFKDLDAVRPEDLSETEAMLFRALDRCLRHVADDSTDRWCRMSERNERENAQALARR